MAGRAGLGRITSIDSRDRAFRMAAPQSDLTYRNWLVPGGVTDQGSTSQCVAYACEAWLRAHPVVNAHKATNAIVQAELYHQAQLIDEWEGEDYDGTSVRAGFQALRAMGFVSSFHWGWDIVTVRNHVLNVGPVVVGTDWHQDMANPDQFGYIAPSGPVYGGHAYLITGANLSRPCPDGNLGAFRIQNSWGKGWGNKGRAWISIAHMATLLLAYGEACTAIEIKKAS